MISKLRFSFLTMIFIVLFSFGCAKNPDTGEVEIPPAQIASSIQVGLQEATYQLLDIVSEQAPSELESVQADLDVLLLNMDGIIETGVNVNTVGSLVLDTIDRVDARLEVLDNDKLTQTLRLVKAAIAIAQGYFQQYELPEHVKLWAQAAAEGIRAGIAEYQGSLVIERINKTLGYDASRLVLNMPGMEVIR